MVHRTPIGVAALSSSAVHGGLGLDDQKCKPTATTRHTNHGQHRYLQEWKANVHVNRIAHHTDEQSKLRVGRLSKPDSHC